MSNEADTCRKYVVPNLHNAGWDEDQIREQVTFTDGQIVVAGSPDASVASVLTDFRLGEILPAIRAFGKPEEWTSQSRLTKAMSLSDEIRECGLWRWKIYSRPGAQLH